MSNTLSSLIGVVAGWILTLLSITWKEKREKYRCLRALLSELHFNYQLTDHYYDLYSACDIKPSANEILKQEIVWSFQTLVYQKATSEGYLIDLPGPIQGKFGIMYKIITSLYQFSDGKILLPDLMGKEEEIKIVKSKLLQLRDNLFPQIIKELTTQV